MSYTLVVEIHLQKIRKKKKLSIRKLSQMSGVSKSSISYIENNESSPTLYTICLLAYALDVDPRDLYSVSKRLDT